MASSTKSRTITCLCVLILAFIKQLKRKGSRFNPNLDHSIHFSLSFPQSTWSKNVKQKTSKLKKCGESKKTWLSISPNLIDRKAQRGDRWDWLSINLYGFFLFSILLYFKLRAQCACEISFPSLSESRIISSSQLTEIDWPFWLWFL